MAPQIENAQPLGVSSVSYLSDISPVRLLKIPTKQGNIIVMLNSENFKSSKTQLLFCNCLLLHNKKKI